MGNRNIGVNWLTREFFVEHHIGKGMSFPAIARMLAEQNVSINQATLSRRAHKLGIVRKTGDLGQLRDSRPLDYTVSFITDEISEWIDGFLLGDGTLTANTSSLTPTARASCGVEHKEFAKYLISGFRPYHPKVFETAERSMRSGIKHCGITKFHPDLRVHRDRWYVEVDGKLKKCVPCDVRITPQSVMLWYLADGSLVEPGPNAVAIRLSTDGLLCSCVERLVIKLAEVGIAAHRNNDNRVWIEARGIPAFFKFIGKSSPVNCYSYKFDLPEWRFDAKRMSDVASELNVDYHRVAHLVKTGKLSCFRASNNGRPRFLPEHIAEAKKLIKSGELY